MRSRLRSAVRSVQLWCAVIYFGVETGGLLTDMRDRCDVIGLDWRQPWTRAGVLWATPSVQGNLDPITLLLARSAGVR